MPPERPFYRDRARAESFGAVAADYDRFRPGYPAQLIDDLVALRPSRVLDVGCGTGKASRLLVARGLPVLGVEVSAEMAAVARRHGVEVELARFEEWDARGRTFDLIVSAQAWHWVDPQAGAVKAAGLLNAGGTLALFWNFAEPDDATRRLIDEVYAVHAPELAGTPLDRDRRQRERPSVDGLRASGRFGSITERTYPGRSSLPVDDWVARLGTHSDHLRLGPERLARLQAALRETLPAALADTGGEVRLHGGTYTIYARP